LDIKVLTCEDAALWAALAEYAKNCSWQTTGIHFSNKMKRNEFVDWEMVFIALKHGVITGFCALTKRSDVFNIHYTPLIGFVFVGEEYRGNRIGEKLCFAAIEYAKRIGFEKVYLYSDLSDYYEKIGFIKIGEVQAPWGVLESIYSYDTV
jgi:predicted N-acetyltransferase YhbS